MVAACTVAELLGDLLAADKVGQEFSTTIFRLKSENNETYNFLFDPAFPRGPGSHRYERYGTPANCFRMFIPYLGQNIALIGSDTFGKPVGQIARDRRPATTACAWSPSARS